MGEEEVKRSLQGDTRLDTFLVVRWPEGSPRHISVIAQMHRDSKGHPLRMVVINMSTLELNGSSSSV